MTGIVTLKAWKRPDMLKRVLDSLKTTYEFEKYKYIISIDTHPQTNADSISVVKAFKNETNVDIDLYVHQSNLGCAGNTKFCFEKAFNNTKYDYMIHLEDDTIMTKDAFNFMKWGAELSFNDDSIFAITPFIRKERQKLYSQLEVLTINEINYVFKHKDFDAGGGFAITRNIYDYINSLGGIFGVIGNCEVNLNPIDWKNSLTITNKGSWAWPFHKFFIRDKYMVSTYISRSNNIGDVDGLFNPSAEWHRAHIWDDRWINSELFTNVSEDILKRLEYRIV